MKFFKIDKDKELITFKGEDCNITFTFDAFNDELGSEFEELLAFMNEFSSEEQILNSYFINYYKLLGSLDLDFDHFYSKGILDYRVNEWSRDGSWLYLITPDDTVLTTETIAIWDRGDVVFALVGIGGVGRVIWVLSVENEKPIRKIDRLLMKNTRVGKKDNPA